MAETAITEVAVPVAKWTMKKLWQELGYMFCYKSNIGDLNEQVQQLRHKKDGIELEEKFAREASMIIDGQVFDWLVKAGEQIKEKETTFSEETVAARAACCNGWLPNLKGRFSLGRNAKKMTLAVDQLLTKDIGIIAHPEMWNSNPQSTLISRKPTSMKVPAPQEHQTMKNHLHLRGKIFFLIQEDQQLAK
ncbi:hypothetical protein ACLB2K_015080 [Fragaria x ananassa]